jgi:hypothetical protein
MCIVSVMLGRYKYNTDESLVPGPSCLEVKIAIA